jgi:hypothetical protein
MRLPASRIGAFFTCAALLCTLLYLAPEGSLTGGLARPLHPWLFVPRSSRREEGPDGREKHTHSTHRRRAACDRSRLRCSKLGVAHPPVGDKNPQWVSVTPTTGL